MSEKLVKIVTMQGVTLSKPALDHKGKPITAKIKFNNRDIETEVHDIERHAADTVVEVTRPVAEELLSKKFARLVDAALDDEVDPTKGDDGKGTDPLA